VLLALPSPANSRTFRGSKHETSTHAPYRYALPSHFFSTCTRAPPHSLRLFTLQERANDCAEPSTHAISSCSALRHARVRSPSPEAGQRMDRARPARGRRHVPRRRRREPRDDHRRVYSIWNPVRPARGVAVTVTPPCQF
jgi:hypothetical protein